MEIKPLRLLASLILSPVAMLAAGENVSLASFDFNDGFQGWTPQTGTGLEWKIMEVAPAGDAISFSNFDPTDISSLFTIAPLMRMDRTHSYITSPSIHIEPESTLEFYVGFSSFYDFACRLQLLVSTDGFKTSKVLWNSKNAEGPQSWHWRYVNVPLQNYADREITFRFYYTTGYDDNAADRGGYAGDFGIDNFSISAEVEDTGVESVYADDIVEIYTSQGVCLYSGAFSEAPSLKGLHIIRSKSNVRKILF